MTRLAGTGPAAGRRAGNRAANQRKRGSLLCSLPDSVFAAFEVDPLLLPDGFQNTLSIVVVLNGSPLNPLPTRDALTNVTLVDIAGM